MLSGKLSCLVAEDHACLPDLAKFKLAFSSDAEHITFLMQQRTRQMPSAQQQTSKERARGAAIATSPTLTCSSAWLALSSQLWCQGTRRAATSSPMPFSQVQPARYATCMLVPVWRHHICSGAHAATERLQQAWSIQAEPGTWHYAALHGWVMRVSR